MTSGTDITTQPDYSLLASIHTRCFSKGWNAGEFAAMFANGGILAFVAKGKAGFGVLRIIGNEAEIITLAVLPEHQKKHIGTQILSAMLKSAGELGVEEVFLEVREKNIPAINLYEKSGFAILAKRKGYYSNADGTSEDAIVMKKGL